MTGGLYIKKNYSKLGPMSELQVIFFSWNVSEQLLNSYKKEGLVSESFICSNDAPVSASECRRINATDSILRSFSRPVWVSCLIFSFKQQVERDEGESS